MATGTILLWPGEVTLPDGTTNNAWARAQVFKSTGTPPTNGPNLFAAELLFGGGANDEHAFFGFGMPQDYSSGGTLYINWKRASGTGAANVVWKGAVAAVTPGGTEVPNSKALNTVATTTTAAGTTVQALQQTTITLTMDSAAARDSVWVMLGRDSSNASDTLDAVDAQVASVWLEYTTT